MSVLAKAQRSCGGGGSNSSSSSSAAACCTLIAPSYLSSLRLPPFVSPSASFPALRRYGVLGDGVNLAARIKKLNGRYGTRLLLSEDAAAEPGMREHFVMRPIDCVVVKVCARCREHTLPSGLLLIPATFALLRWSPLPPPLLLLLTCVSPLATCLPNCPPPQGKTEPIKLYEVMARRAQRITSRPALKHEKGVAPPPRDFDSLYRASLGLMLLEKAAIVHTHAMDAFLSQKVRFPAPMSAALWHSRGSGIGLRRSCSCVCPAHPSSVLCASCIV